MSRELVVGLEPEIILSNSGREMGKKVLSVGGVLVGVLKHY